MAVRQKSSLRLGVAVALSASLAVVTGVLVNLVTEQLAPRFKDRPELVWAALGIAFLVSLPIAIYITLSGGSEHKPEDVPSTEADKFAAQATEAVNQAISISQSMRHKVTDLITQFVVLDDRLTVVSPILSAYFKAGALISSSPPDQLGMATRTCCEFLNKLDASACPTEFQALILKHLQLLQESAAHFDNRPSLFGMTKWQTELSDIGRKLDSSAQLLMSYYSKLNDDTEAIYKRVKIEAEALEKQMQDMKTRFPDIYNSMPPDAKVPVSVPDFKRS